MRGKVYLLLVYVIFFTTSIAGAVPPDSLCNKFANRLNIGPELKPVTWQDMEFVNSFQKSDFSFVVVTNRQLVKRKGLLYFSNTRDSSKIHYLVVSKKGDSWQLLPGNNFEESMHFIDDRRPLLFYVHGYGKTFPGVINDGIGFKRFYGVNLVIFDWPSRIPEAFELTSYKISEKYAENSSGQLAHVLKEFQEYKKQNWNSHQVSSTLLFHSMGNIILEEMVNRNEIKDLERNLFTSVILNSPAVKLVGHNEWVEKLNFQEQVYIISNQKDLSFLCLWIITFKRQLGAVKLAGNSKKANNAIYINFSEAAGRRHTVFINPVLMNEKPSLLQFYTDLLIRDEDIKTNCLLEKRNYAYYLK